MTGETATQAAERLARAKAFAARAAAGDVVLAADTLVSCAGEILGKPSSDAEAASMLRRLSGRDHEVVTGVCVFVDGIARSAVARTTVSFATLDEDDIAAYVATGEPRDKAGGYHIEGRGAVFVEGIAGSPSNVAGFPIALVARLVRESGIDLFSFGAVSGQATASAPSR